MRFITFSERFPAYHPRKGERTRFVEKIWAGLADNDYVMDDTDFTNIDFDFNEYYSATPKYHTIRTGKRWEAGEFFKPMIWSGRPYHSKMIQFAPPIEIKKVWQYESGQWGDYERWYLNGNMVIEKNNSYDGWMNQNLLETISKNDGLALPDFLEWFKHPAYFSGQIICWNDKITY